MVTLSDYIKATSIARRALDALARRDFDALAERWLDEASEAALAGNPRRAFYIEHRLLRGRA